MATDVHPIPESSPAGFWLRFTAAALDITLIAGVVISAAHVAARMGWYLSIELAALVLLTVVNILSGILWQRSLGKWICSLTITTNQGRAPSLRQIILRETVGKLCSLAPLGLGFFWCGFNRRKRAWHDLMAGTMVIRADRPWSRGARRVAALFVSAVLMFALDVPGWFVIARDYAMMRMPGPVRWPFESRETSTLVETGSLTATQRDDCVRWLRDNAAQVMEYAAARARQHQVLVFGELHEKKEALDLLNRLIPELHTKAGLTCVAMEVCLAEDNERIERLVNAPAFDRELALEIARHQPWGVWGFKEYWDVLETVWRVNQTTPAGTKKLRLIGLDSAMDMPSIGVLGLEGEEGRKYPAVEKLRVVRLARVGPKVAARDLQMAARIEREIFAKDERAIVWVGAQHARACPMATSANLSVSRMGAMLRRRHGSDIFFIHLHGWSIPASWVDRSYRGPEPTLDGRIEELMKVRGLDSVGFDLGDSPLGRLRDLACFDYHYESRLALADTADGYIYLKASGEFTQCSWLPGYVTPLMFAANKPFYRGFGSKDNRRLDSAEDVNRLFAE